MNNLLEITKRLLESIPLIDSFDAVAKWDNEAREHVISLNNGIKEVKEKINILKSELETIQNEFQKLPFYKKIFTSKKEQFSLKDKIGEQENQEKVFIQCIDLLEEWIEKTPDNKSEADLMLKELKLMKKELSTAKKEVSAQIKDINEKTRIQNAKISSQYFSSSQSKQIQKIQLRMNKENALLSQQDQKAAIEKQIIDIEKMIIWIEKIKM